MYRQLSGLRQERIDSDLGPSEKGIIGPLTYHTQTSINIFALGPLGECNYANILFYGAGKHFLLRFIVN